MGDQDRREINGHVFLPKHFYRQLADGVANPDGRFRVKVYLHQMGLIELPSEPVMPTFDQIWLSGLYSESLRLHDFIDQIKAGLVPPAITGLNYAELTARFIYTSPESLIRYPTTFVAALGCADLLTEAALKSDRFLCNGCGGEVRRYKTASEAINEIASTINGSSVSIYLESTSERLSAWALNKGMKFTVSTSGIYSVLFDSEVRSQERLLSLSSLIKSTWKLPGISLVCRQDERNIAVVSKDGYCCKCSSHFHPINKALLNKLLVSGERPKEFTTPIEAIQITPALTIRDLLDKPISNADLSFNKYLSSVASLIRDLGLSHLSLGTRAEELGFQDLAKLSIAASLIKGGEANEPTIISLPSGIFSGTDSDIQLQILRRNSSNRAIYLNDNIFADEAHKDNYSNATELDPEIATRPGEITFLPNSRFSFKDTLDCIQEFITTRSINQSIHTVPLFKSNRVSSAVVGGELKLFEPLTKLYAASLDALVHGLTNKDFAILGTRSPRYVCSRCRGLGVTLTENPGLTRPIAQRCDVCAGARCDATIGSCLFRGISFSTILNRSMSESIDVLSSLPKAKSILEIVWQLDLLELPLGMPTALLELSEARRLALAAALIEARPARPSLLVFEGLKVGLSPSHQAAIIKLRDAALAERSLAWIEITQ
jgi:hypothetical protein